MVFGSSSGDESWGINWKREGEIIAYHHHMENDVEILGDTIVEVYLADYAKYDDGVERIVELPKSNQTSGAKNGVAAKRWKMGSRSMSDDQSDKFVRRWRALGDKMGLNRAKSQEVADYLLGQYSESTRHYHGVSHVVSMLEGFDAITPSFEQPLAAELAIFFHDVIYDPSRHDNESQSAKQMQDLLGGLVDRTLLESAARSIEATRQHVRTPNHDTNLLIDLDMAILGQPWPVYELYAKGVMQEYLQAYGEFAYRHGRRTLFLEPTIAHGTVFLTDAFQSLNPQAIENLRREAEILKSGQPYAQ